MDGNGCCLDVQPDDNSDALAEVLVGEADSVADKELFALRSWWRCRFDVFRGTRNVRNDRRVQHAPTASSYAVLNHCLGLAQFDDGALCRRSKRVVTNVVDGHPQKQALTYFENT